MESETTTRFLRYGSDLNNNDRTTSRTTTEPENNDHSVNSEQIHINNARTRTWKLKTVGQIYTDTIRYTFLTGEHILEIVIALAIFVAGKSIPRMLATSLFFQRQIPYQISAAGDVFEELELSNELRDQTVTTGMLFLTCSFLPFLLLLCVSALFGHEGDSHSISCVFLFGLGCNWFITDMTKLYVGYLRPNFYDMCGFNPDSLQCESESANGLLNSRMSFPSGHSSISFASMTIISLYFLGKVGLHRSPSLKAKLLSMLAALPFLYSIFIAASRIHDSFHHPADVIAGGLIGSACAHFSYSLWYSSIYSETAGESLEVAHRRRGLVYESGLSQT